MGVVGAPDSRLDFEAIRGGRARNRDGTEDGVRRSRDGLDRAGQEREDNEAQQEKG